MSDYVTMDEQRKADRERAEDLREQMRGTWDEAEYAYIASGGRADFADGLVANRQAWHGFARVYDEGGTEGIPIEVAKQDPAVNWTVSKHPEYTFIPGYGLKPHEGKYAIVRDDNLEQFAVVGEQFQPIQNSRCFEFLQQLVDQEELFMETVISLREGKTVAIEARRPEHILIAGEEYMDYLGIINPHDGTGALVMLATKERLVCKNTCQFAVNNAKALYRIRHTANAEVKLTEARELLEISFQYTAALKEFGEELAMERISDAAFDDFLSSLIPEPEKKYGTTDEGVLYVTNEREIANRAADREEVKQNFMTSDNLENIRGKRNAWNKWGLLQGVTEWEQHIRTYASRDSRAEALMGGGDYARRAVAILAA